MYKSMKGNSCRQILAKLADSIASDKEDINFQIKRFGYLLDEMTADNEKNSILKRHADRLEELVTQLDRTRNELETSNLSMADINGELKRSELKLVIDLKPALSFEQLDQRVLRDFEENKNNCPMEVPFVLLSEAGQTVPVVWEKKGPACTPNLPRV